MKSAWGVAFRMSLLKIYTSKFVTTLYSCKCQISIPAIYRDTQERVLWYANLRRHCIDTLVISPCICTTPGSGAMA